MKVHKYADLIREYFYLDSAGHLRYRIDSYKGLHKAGELTKSHTTNHGYKVVTLPTTKVDMQVSHIVALLYYVDLPKLFEVDHRDGIRTNNIPSNIRLVNDELNSKNRKKRIDNTTGITGVSYKSDRSRKKPYHVRKVVHGVRISTYCRTIEEAEQVVKELTQLDGNYTERHGK